MIAQVLELRLPPRRHLPDPRRSPNVHALKLEARPGCCIVCDERLPQSRGKKPRTDLCGTLECKRVYDRACAMDSEHRQKTRVRRRLRNLGAL